MPQAHETIFRLNQLLQAQSRNLYKGIKLTRNQQTILDILLRPGVIFVRMNFCMRRFMFQGKVENRDHSLSRETSSSSEEIKKHGIDIETVFGRGYIMNIENKAKLKAFILNDDEAG